MPPFIPLPRFMLAGEYSINAKLLYGLLLNRTMLSQKSGWVSEDGNVYVIYTIKQMADDLDRSERTVKTALRELENAGLITRVRQGWNQANRIFLQIPDRVQVSSRPEGNICPMDVQDSSPCMGQNLPASNTDTEYKEHSKTERVEISLRLDHVRWRQLPQKHRCRQSEKGGLSARLINPRKELLHGELHRHRSDPSENDTDHQGGGRIQQD